MCKALLYPPSGPPLRVLVSNISMTGVGLRTTQPLNLGAGYRVTVEVGPLTLRSGVEIVRCVPRDDRSFEVGGRLDVTDLAAGRRESALGRRDAAAAAPARLARSVPRNASIISQHAARGASAAPPRRAA